MRLIGTLLAAVLASGVAQAQDITVATPDSTSSMRASSTAPGIPGYYDPSTGRFTALESTPQPQAAQIHSGTINITPIVFLDQDYATMFCTVIVEFGELANGLKGTIHQATQHPMEPFDPKKLNAPTAHVPYKYATSASNQMMFVTLSCRATDAKDVAHRSSRSLPFAPVQSGTVTQDISVYF